MSEWRCIMKFKFEISKVEFEILGIGFSEGSYETVEYSIDQQKKFPKFISARDEREANILLRLEIERETGMSVSRVFANVVKQEPEA
jgi:hypothetical protein